MSYPTETWAERQYRSLGLTEPLHGPVRPSQEIEEPVGGIYVFIRRWCDAEGEPLPTFAERLRQAELEAEEWLTDREYLSDPDEEWPEESDEEYDWRMMQW